MAIREIRKIPDEILYKKSREVTEFNDRLFTLLDDMYETMQAANGVGLAGPQVGVLRRVAVVDVGDGRYELINPKIIAWSKESECELEGCLSLPGESAEVTRPKSVTVETQTRTGEKIQISGSGLFARALCHEIDHLDGIVYTMKAEK